MGFGNGGSGDRRGPKPNFGNNTKKKFGSGFKKEGGPEHQRKTNSRNNNNNNDVNVNDHNFILTQNNMKAKITSQQYNKYVKPKKEIINPFEARANKKTKFDVVGRRIKGENKNVAKARSTALERRKKTLLVDYQNSKKKNSFHDRRFGENDPSLSLEDRMMIRFQKERQKKAKSSSRNTNMYNLNDDDLNNHQNDKYASGLSLLTHKGKSLSDMNDNFSDGEERSFGDDDDEQLDADITKELHFGGGFQLKSKSGDASSNSKKRSLVGDSDGPPQKKTKEDLLDELIERSKLKKHEKQQLKEKQEETFDQLDKNFKTMSKELEFRGKYNNATVKGKRLDDQNNNSNNMDMDDDDDDYDTLFAEISKESRKAKATDRTKTDIEIATEEYEKLEELEKERQARMNGEITSDNEDDDEEEKNKYAKGRKDNKKDNKKENTPRERTDDDLESDFVVHPKDAIPDMKTDGIKNSKKNAVFGEDDDLYGDDSEADSEADSEEDEDEEEEDQMEIDAKKRKELDVFDGNDEDEEEEEENEEESDDDDDNDDDDKKKVIKKKKELTKEEAKAAREKKMKNQIPFVLPCPANFDELTELIEEYAKTGEDVNTIIDRVRKYHNIRLNTENKNKMHNFYDILLKRFVAIGEQLSRNKMKNDEFCKDRQIQLEFLTTTLYEMTHDMPEVAAAIWGRALGHLKNKIEKNLRDYGLGQRMSCWPSAGNLLLLRLLGHIFPTSDFRHKVVTPALLLLGQCISQCPVNTAWDITAGIFVSTLLLQFVDTSNRFVPEANAFLYSILYQYLPSITDFENLKDTIPLLSVASVHFEWLRKSAMAWKPQDEEKPDVPTIILRQVFDYDLSDEDLKDVSVSILATVYRLLNHNVDKYHLTPECAFLEIYSPIEKILSAMKPAGKNMELPVQLQEMHLNLTVKIREKSVRAEKLRAPLLWQTKKVHVTKSLNPKFQDNFVIKKDSEMDIDKAKMKQLQRQVKRERKGAIRELKRDSAFLDNERTKREDSKSDARKAKVKANMSWLQEQQADFNKQVKLDKDEIKGGGAGRVNIKKGFASRPGL